jgi:hypothetical protein
MRLCRSESRMYGVAWCPWLDMGHTNPRVFVAAPKLMELRLQHHQACLGVDLEPGLRPADGSGNHLQRGPFNLF